MVLDLGKVLDEDDFYICVSSGERVHPAHAAEDDRGPYLKYDPDNIEFQRDKNGRKIIAPHCFLPPHSHPLCRPWEPVLDEDDDEEYGPAGAETTGQTTETRADNKPSTASMTHHEEQRTKTTNSGGYPISSTLLAQLVEPNPRALLPLRAARRRFKHRAPPKRVKSVPPVPIARMIETRGGTSTRHSEEQRIMTTDSSGSSASSNVAIVPGCHLQTRKRPKTTHSGTADLIDMAEAAKQAQQGKVKTRVELKSLSKEFTFRTWNGEPVHPSRVHKVFGNIPVAKLPNKRIVCGDNLVAKFPNKKIDFVEDREALRTRSLLKRRPKQMPARGVSTVPTARMIETTVPVIPGRNKRLKLTHEEVVAVGARGDQADEGVAAQQAEAPVAPVPNANPRLETIHEDVVAEQAEGDDEGVAALLSTDDENVLGEPLAVAAAVAVADDASGDADLAIGQHDESVQDDDEGFTGVDDDDVDEADDPTETMAAEDAVNEPAPVVAETEVAPDTQEEETTAPAPRRRRVPVRAVRRSPRNHPRPATRRSPRIAAQERRYGRPNYKD